MKALSESEKQEFLLLHEKLLLVCKFVENVTRVPCTGATDFFVHGVQLALLAHRLHPDLVPVNKIFDRNLARFEGSGNLPSFRHLDNIHYFVTALDESLIPKIVQPDVRDVYEGHNIAKLITCLLTLQNRLGITVTDAQYRPPSEVVLERMVESMHDCKMPVFEAVSEAFSSQPQALSLASQDTPNKKTLQRSQLPGKENQCFVIPAPNIAPKPLIAPPRTPQLYRGLRPATMISSSCPTTPEFKSRPVVSGSPFLKRDQMMQSQMPPAPSAQQLLMRPLRPGSSDRQPLHNIQDAAVRPALPTSMQEWVLQQRIQRSEGTGREIGSSSAGVEAPKLFTPKKLFDLTETVQDRNDAVVPGDLGGISSQLQNCRIDCTEINVASNLTSLPKQQQCLPLSSPRLPPDALYCSTPSIDTQFNVTDARHRREPSSPVEFVKPLAPSFRVASKASDNTPVSESSTSSFHTANTSLSSSFDSPFWSSAPIIRTSTLRNSSKNAASFSSSVPSSPRCLPGAHLNAVSCEELSVIIREGDVACSPSASSLTVLKTDEHPRKVAEAEVVSHEIQNDEHSHATETSPESSVEQCLSRLHCSLQTGSEVSTLAALEALKEAYPALPPVLPHAASLYHLEMQEAMLDAQCALNLEEVCGGVTLVRAVAAINTAVMTEDARALRVALLDSTAHMQDVVPNLVPEYLASMRRAVKQLVAVCDVTGAGDQGWWQEHSVCSMLTFLHIQQIIDQVNTAAEDRLSLQRSMESLSASSDEDRQFLHPASVFPSGIRPSVSVDKLTMVGNAFTTALTVELGSAPGSPTKSLRPPSCDEGVLSQSGTDVNTAKAENDELLCQNPTSVDFVSPLFPPNQDISLAQDILSSLSQDVASSVSKEFSKDDVIASNCNMTVQGSLGDASLIETEQSTLLAEKSLYCKDANSTLMNSYVYDVDACATSANSTFVVADVPRSPAVDKKLSTPCESFEEPVYAQPDLSKKKNRMAPPPPLSAADDESRIGTAHYTVTRCYANARSEQRASSEYEVIHPVHYTPQIKNNDCQSAVIRQNLLLGNENSLRSSLKENDDSCSGSCSTDRSRSVSFLESSMNADLDLSVRVVSSHPHIHAPPPIETSLRRESFMPRSGLGWTEREIDASIKIQRWWRSMLALARLQTVLDAVRCKSSAIPLPPPTTPSNHSGAASLSGDSLALLSALAPCLHLLPLTTSDLRTEKRLQIVRSGITRCLRVTAQLQQEIDQLDLHIGLLLSNTMNIQDPSLATGGPPPGITCGGQEGGPLDALACVSPPPSASEGRKGSVSHSERRGTLTLATGLKALNKSSRDRLQGYQELFYLLQTRPNYLARLIFALPSAKTTRFVESVVFSIYNYGANDRDNFLLINLLKTALEEEIRCKVLRISDIVSGEPLVIKMIVSFVRKGPGRAALRDILGQLVSQILDDKKLNLNTNPVEIYQAWLNEIEMETGQSSGSPYHVSTDEALQHPQVVARLHNTLENIKRLTSTCCKTITQSLGKLPYALLYLSGVMRKALANRFPHIADKEILKVVGSLIYYRYINSGIVAPDAFDVITVGPHEQLNSRQRRNLATIAKTLQAAATKRGFGADSPHLCSLNPCLVAWHEQFKSFFLSCCRVPGPEAVFAVTQYSEAALIHRPQIHLSVQEIHETHCLVLEHRAVLAPNSEDPLHATLNALPAPDLPALGDAKSEVCLTLKCGQGAPLMAEEKEARSDAETDGQKKLFEKSKQLAVSVLLCHGETVERFNEVTLLDVISSGTSAAQERRYAALKTATADSSCDTLHAAKTRLSYNLRRLQTQGLVSPTDGYCQLLLAISSDVLNQKCYRTNRSRELSRLQLALRQLQQKEQFVREQRDSYLTYLTACRANLLHNCARRPRRSHGPSANVTYSGKRLREKGVLVEIRDFTASQYSSVAFVFAMLDENLLNTLPDVKTSVCNKKSFGKKCSEKNKKYKEPEQPTVCGEEKDNANNSGAVVVDARDTVSVPSSLAEASVGGGVFSVTVKYRGVVVDAVRISIQELLQLQYEGVRVKQMAGARVNVNLLLHLLNTKFFTKKK